MFKSYAFHLLFLDNHFVDSFLRLQLFFLSYLFRILIVVIPGKYFDCFVVLVDDSSIDFVQSYTINGIRKFDCFAVYDNVADGNRFLFFDYKSQIAYITPTCFFGFYPIYSSVDFSRAEVLLRNEHSYLKQSSDTLSIDSKVTYVPFNCNNRIIKATFVPCSQAGKDNNISTTKDSIRSILSVPTSLS